MADYGKKQDAGDLTHFGYQILSKMLQQWCKGHDFKQTRIGMNPGMRKVCDMHNVLSIELVNVVDGGLMQSQAQNMVKTPRMSNTTIPYKHGLYGYSGNGMVVLEIAQMLRNMEKTLMEKMEAVEKKVDEVVQRMRSEEGGQIMEHNLEESESPDAKQYQAILKAELRGLQR